MSKFFKRAFSLVAGALAIALAGIGAMNIVGVSPFPLNQEDRSQTVLLTSIQELSEYHAAVGNFEVTLDIEEQDISWAPAFVSGRQSLVVAAGTVNASVDLSGLSSDDLTLSTDGDSATVRLPEPQLDKPNLDLERSYVVGQERGILDWISDAIESPDQAELFQRAETRMAEAAEQSELRVQAAENTRAMLTGMFGSLGIEVVFL